MYSHIFGHASLTTNRRDFGHEFTGGKFPNPPKFVVDLPQSVLECVFNAQRCVRCCCEFRSLYTTSAYKEAAHVSSVSNKAVCVCVCVQAVRSQDFLSIILGHSLRNYMR